MRSQNTDDAHLCKASVFLKDFEAGEGEGLPFHIKRCPGVKHKMSVLNTYQYLTFTCLSVPNAPAEQRPYLSCSAVCPQCLEQCFAELKIIAFDVLRIKLEPSYSQNVSLKYT